MELVSVIIPVYKVEKYLKQCVESVTKQTYQNLEIILVDDGSPDLCHQICDELAQKDNRIKVIHKSNGGLSSARNAGLDVCTGEYITFVDSDDFLDKDFILISLNKLKEFNVDTVFAGVEEHKIKDDKEILNSIGYEDEIVLSGEEKFKELYIASQFSFVMSVSKLFKREVFASLRFPLDRIHEDNAVILDILKNSKSVLLIKENLYHYIRREGSITTSKISEKRIQSLFLNYKESVQFLKNENLNQFLDLNYIQYFYYFWGLFRDCNDRKTRKIIRSYVIKIKKEYKPKLKLNKTKFSIFIRKMFIFLNIKP